MANWEEDPQEAKNYDEKRRKEAEEVLRKYFEDRIGKETNQDTLYNSVVSFEPDKNEVVHWAFYEWINNEIREGRMEKEPITKVVGYKLTYLGDD